MKTLFFFIFTGLLFSCSSQDNTKDNISENKTTADETALSACEVCILQSRLSDLEKQEIEFSVKKLNDCENKLLSKVKSEKDSLGKIVKELLTQYKLDFNTVGSKCAELYPMNKISDENIRDSLLYEIAHWNFYERTLYITPEFDTTCGKRDYYEDGKFGLKVNGEIVWVSEEKYPSLVNKYFTTKQKIDNLIKERKKAIVTKLTGIENPDEYCMEIMNQKSGAVANRVSQKYNTLHQDIDDPELNELLATIRRID